LQGRSDRRGFGIEAKAQNSRSLGLLLRARLALLASIAGDQLNGARPKLGAPDRKKLYMSSLQDCDRPSSK
jgi:hypothetical protein